MQLRGHRPAACANRKRGQDSSRQSTSISGSPMHVATIAACNIVKTPLLTAEERWGMVTRQLVSDTTSGIQD